MLLRQSRPACTRRLRRPFFWRADEDPRWPLIPAETVPEWMEEEAQLVDPNLNPFRRAELYMNLRILHGLNLPDFMTGCAHAYDVVTLGMYSRDWTRLQPLVSKNCLEAMEGAMETFGDAGQRIQAEEADFKLLSCRLHKAQVLMPSDDVPRGSCELSVHFLSEETFKIFDFHTNELVPPFDGRARQQESTWVFSGVVSADDEQTRPWQVERIV